MHHGHQIAEHPETSGDRQLGKDRHGRDQENGQADGVGDDGDAAGHHQTGGGFDGGLFFVATAFELLEKPLAKLDRVADGSRRDQKGTTNINGSKL